LFSRVSAAHTDAALSTVRRMIAGIRIFYF
jgi:hypothetical protein